jgi:hypothetical protein
VSYYVSLSKGHPCWFLRVADRRRVEAVMNGILAADSKLTMGRILRRLLDPDESRNPAR